MRLFVSRLAPALLAAAVVAAPAGARNATAFPHGVFRTTITDADLLAGHVGVNDIPENHGTFTLTIGAHGHWRLVQRAPNPLHDPVFAGAYTVRGSTVDFRTATPTRFAGDDLVVWGFDGKYLRLRLKSYSPYPETYVLYHAHPWRKVG